VGLVTCRLIKVNGVDGFLDVGVLLTGVSHRGGGCPWSLLLQYLCAPCVLGHSLLADTRCMPSVFIVRNIVVAFGWLSGGDVESSVLLPLHARTHSLNANTTKKKKKMLSCYQSCYQIKRRLLHMVSEPVRPVTWDSLRLSLIGFDRIILLLTEWIVA
jgi:hypothetical protein